MWATEWLCAILALQLCLQCCLWLSHEMPRQGAISDFLHHIDNLVHYQSKILQFSVHSWLLVLTQRNFFGLLGHHSMAGLSCTAPCPAWCISPKISLVFHQVNGHFCGPHLWSCLCSCPLAGFAGLGSMFGCFFPPTYLLSKNSSWHIKAKPVENWSQPGLGFGHWRTRDGQHLCSRAERWAELGCAGDSEHGRAATALCWMADEGSSTEQPVPTSWILMSVYR